MWSKTKQALESRLAEGLKGRVSYHYDVYRTKKCKEKPWWGGSTMHVLSILVDGTPWFCSNPMFFREKYGKHPMPPDEEIIRETGWVACEWGRPATGYIHQYLNVLSIEEAIAHENYFIRLLAVLDARLGRRKIKELADNVANEPEWFRKWILLRARGTGAVVESPDEGERHIGEDMAVKWKKETLLPMQIWIDESRAYERRGPANRIAFQLDASDELKPDSVGWMDLDGNLSPESPAGELAEGDLGRLRNFVRNNRSALEQLADTAIHLYQIWPDIIKGGTPATAEEIKSLADKVAALVESNKNRP